MKRTLLLLIACAGLLPAENRALLIGIGKYQTPSFAPTLPGIDLDIKNMEVVAAKMGFQPQQIKILFNEQATLDGIRNALQHWLVEGTKPNDRVLLYFSGHGWQVTDQPPLDEEDGLDEVLIPYDAAPDPKHVLIDDEVGVWLAKIPSNNVFVILDSCHSGSATKGIAPHYTDFVAKYIYGHDMPPNPNSPKATPEPNGFVASKAVGERINYLSLAAARDDESANATRQGSVLTYAIRRVFDSGAKNITFATLQQAAAQECDAFTEAARKAGKQVSQHPMLFGDERKKDIVISSGGGTDAPPTQPPAQPPVATDPFSKWESLIDHAPAQLPRLTANQQNFREGQNLSLEIQVPRAGYLTVINVSEGEQEAILIYPNQFVPDGKVAANQTVHIPGGAAKWHLPAALPQNMAAQRNLFVAFLTDKPLDAKAAKDVGAFKDLGADLPRSFTPTAGAAAGGGAPPPAGGGGHPEWYGKKLYVNIVKK